MQVTSKPTHFIDKLQSYKKLIDKDIPVYSEPLVAGVNVGFGDRPKLVAETFMDVLSRGGKRVRGALAMHAYEMSGGKDAEMILAAARALEMIHAYILIVDDIQDRSILRRGAPTAHIALKKYHENHNLKGDAAHFGVALALNAALFGAHAAQEIMTQLDAPDDVKLLAIQKLNESMMITAHGQTEDIFAEVASQVSAADTEAIMQYKTANYTIKNPLQIGLILAGHGGDAYLAEEFAMHAGRAFQISDDILGTFSDSETSGKATMDDIKEGKRTLLINHALKHATPADQDYLLQTLGNNSLSQAEFKRCKQILIECTALDFAKSELDKSCLLATAAAQKFLGVWPNEGVEFLTELVGYIQSRNA